MNTPIVRECGSDSIALATLESVVSKWFILDGDVFYLRALLLHRSAHDWVDLRTIDGIVYGTYQEAARAMGLFDNRDEGIMAFEELLNFGPTSPITLDFRFVGNRKKSCANHLGSARGFPFCRYQGSHAADNLLSKPRVT